MTDVLKEEMIIESKDISDVKDDCEEIDEKINDGTENERNTEMQKVDPFLYTKRDEFTSEIYKIEIGNLPINFGYGQLKKLLNNKLHLNSHKIKGVSSHSTWAFVTFRCNEDRERALKTLDGYKWKGKTLTVKTAAPIADPLTKKRKAEEISPVKRQKINETEEPIHVSEKLKNAVSPLADMPYEEQLKKKETNSRYFLINLGRKIKKSLKECPKWLQQKWKEGKICCTLNPILPSPRIEGYRNKCEFTVGFGPNEERTVGFRLTRYTAGSMTVADVSDCKIISKKMKDVVQSFQEFVRNSSLEPYNPESYSGYWRQLTVRLNEDEDVMVIVVIHPQKLSQEELSNIKESISQHFTSGSGQTLNVTSVYFQLLGNRVSGEPPQLEHITGKQYICESLLGMKFRISPDAFFQINTAATEILYKEIGKHVQENPSAAVVDICCGTGTIGISLSKYCSKVWGIEMNKHAIDDAQFNAEMNGIDNTTFICGKAEDVLYSTLGLVDGESLVAIVDPPRAGLHNRVIKLLRSCELIKQLIYISCDAKAAMMNFIDLIRPVSNQYRGEPFMLSSATPVDLFPHTNHCELIFVFERIPSKKIVPNTAASEETANIIPSIDIGEEQCST